MQVSGILSFSPRPPEYKCVDPMSNYSRIVFLWDFSFLLVIAGLFSPIGESVYLQ